MADLPRANQGELDSAGQNEAEGIKGKEEIICFLSAVFFLQYLAILVSTT